MKLLDEGLVYEEIEWFVCPTCGDWDTLKYKSRGLAAVASDPTCLMSHLIEGVVLPSTVVRAAIEAGAYTVLGDEYDSSTGTGSMGSGNKGYDRYRSRVALKTCLTTIYY